MRYHSPYDPFLPPQATLLDAPQLSSLVLLELALIVVPRDLDLHDDAPGALIDIAISPPDNPTAALLARLISDRCRDLLELTATYRAILTDASLGPHPDLHPSERCF